MHAGQRLLGACSSEVRHHTYCNDTRNLQLLIPIEGCIYCGMSCLKRGSAIFKNSILLSWDIKTHTQERKCFQHPRQQRSTEEQLWIQQGHFNCWKNLDKQLYVLTTIIIEFSFVLLASSNILLFVHNIQQYICLVKILKLLELLLKLEILFTAKVLCFSNNYSPEKLYLILLSA